MLRGLRIRRAHTRFLDSCRSLGEDSTFWKGVAPWRQRLLADLLPIPLLGLHEKGIRLLQALEWIETHATQELLTVERLLHYHRMLSPESPEGAGTYRKVGVGVIGSTLPRAEAKRIPVLMQQLNHKLESVQAEWDARGGARKEDLLRFCAEVYYRIGWVHPFGDGNGRVARLALCHLTRRYGNAYIVLPPLTADSDHWKALLEGQSGRFDLLSRLMTVHFLPV